MENINSNSSLAVDQMNNSSLNQKEEKRYNYFYKITNKLNGKYYYGVHTTNNLDDGYFGSGTAISGAVQKYGKGNFIKENLKFFSTSEEAFDYESKIVDKDLIKDPNCYNIKPGGGGGYSIGKATVKDKDGNMYQIDKSDPRYNKELTPVSTGRKHVFKQIEGEFINKYVLKEEVDLYLDNGWVLGTPNEGKVWIRLENESGEIVSRKMINGKELDKYLQKGWLLGGKISSKTTSGQIYIHRTLDNGKIEKCFVTTEELEDYLNNGWDIGCEQKGMKRVHKVNPDGTETLKTVSKEEYEIYLNNGWKPGYSEDHTRFATQKGRKRIYKEESDGTLRLLSILEEDMNKYLLSGWKIGTKHPKKLCLTLMSKKLENKTVDQVYVPEKEIDVYISKGYRLGKIK
jgi:hypothetical protein